MQAQRAREEVDEEEDDEEDDEEYNEQERLLDAQEFSDLEDDDDEDDEDDEDDDDDDDEDDDDVISSLANLQVWPEAPNLDSSCLTPAVQKHYELLAQSQPAHRPSKVAPKLCGTLQ